jgi:ribosomal protein L11 methyltransferase
MSWLELSVDADQEAVESISELLARYGYNGGVVIDQPIITGVDGPEYRYDTGQPATLRTYLPLDEHAEETRVRIEQALWHLGRMRPIGPLRVQQLEEQDWADAWKQHYTIQRIGVRTVIVPSWLEYAPQPDDVVLRLDPGMAFGTGLHPTTQLCVQLLERYVKQNDHVIDLGCGSGILALAAAQLGAAIVLALDTDPIAVDATRENVRRNGVDNRVRVEQGSLGSGAALAHWLYPTTEIEHDNRQPMASDSLSCNLIVANIIARVIAALAPDLAATLAPAGVLIASGIIAEREAEVVAALSAVGLTALERQQEGDWVALVYQKAAR